MAQQLFKIVFNCNLCSLTLNTQNILNKLTFGLTTCGLSFSLNCYERLLHVIKLQALEMEILYIKKITYFQSIVYLYKEKEGSEVFRLNKNLFCNF